MDTIFSPQKMRNTFLNKFTNLLMEPYFLIRTCLMPGGSIFAAYDYSITYKDICGKRTAVFADDLPPHFFQNKKEIDLPIRNQLYEVGFNIVNTEYTAKNFFVDKTNHILYLKQTDLTSFGDFTSSSRLIHYIHQKRRYDYAAEAVLHIDKS